MAVRLNRKPTMGSTWEALRQRCNGDSQDQLLESKISVWSNGMDDGGLPLEDLFGRSGEENGEGEVVPRKEGA
jgi:hypothetical protein